MRGVYLLIRIEIEIEIISTSKKEEEEEIAHKIHIVNKRETLIILTIFLIYLVNLNND